MKFSDKFIQNIKPAAKQYYKREAEGFAVRVLPSGFKTWLFIYNHKTKRRQMNLGDYPDVSLATARERAADARKVLKEGADPQEHGFPWHHDPERVKREAEKAKQEDEKNPTVKQLATEYMRKHANVNKRASSAKEDQRLLDKDVLPAWGERKAQDIRKRDVIRLLEDAAERGPALCHNIFKLVRKMYNFAVSRDILENTPCVGVKINEIATITSRQRVLKEAKDNNGVDEILTFWTELDKASMSDEVKRILKLILVTGQRPGEVAGMHSDEISIEVKQQKDRKGNIREWKEAWWTIPVARRKVKEKSKNPPQPHRVFMNSLALELIGDKEGYKFPSPKITKDEHGKVIETHIDENAVAYAIRRNLKDYKPRRKISGDTVKMVKVAEDKKMDLEHYTPHDLRRTCSTRLAELGFKDEINDAILGHVKSGVVGIYNRYRYDKEKQQAMEAWGRKLNSIIKGQQPSNVIPISASKVV